MIFYVSNYDRIYCFIEQKSITKDKEFLSWFTKNDDVARNHGTKRSDDRYSSGKHRSKQWKCTMMQIICQKLFVHLCLSEIHFWGW